MKHGRIIGRLAGPVGLGVLIAAALLGSPGGRLRGDAASGRARGAVRPATPDLPGSLSPVDAWPTPSVAPRASGPAVVGSTVTLSCAGVDRPGTQIRWVQVEGPRADLDDPTASTPRFVVPDGAGALGFLLVAGDSADLNTYRLTIPIVPREVAPAVSVRADAGDDQFGMVGSQVTLNGVRSEPRGTIGYRWIQVGGPPVRLQLSDGYLHTFVPPATGVYRFALVVAAYRQISEPDVVAVSVGASAPTARADASILPPEGFAELARGAVEATRADRPLAEGLAGVFEGIADRMALYGSYDELQSELSRRLDAVLPEEPARRAVWADRVFQPLTARLIEVLRAEGMDLRLPEGRAAGINQAQRARFAEVFRALGDGFRPLPAR